ncbi:hypothetical protein EDB84DRAFT_1677720 [Lactarius hengduanensis]|nr:hypothetical protein EDB84DRAFT_1677720 [Lactarius hengduanensis]
MSSNSSPNIQINVLSYDDEYKQAVYDNLFVGIVYGEGQESAVATPVSELVRCTTGVYIVLYVASVHVLLVFMFGITTFMFALGVITLDIQYFLGTTSANTWSFDRIFVVLLVEGTIARLMYILSDIVCAWRAVVLWNRDKRVIAILLLLILGTTAAAGCELGFNLVPPSGPASFQSNGPLIMVGPTLATNLVSTGLIAWKAWQHRVSIRKHLGNGTGSMRVDRVFALLIESGFLYCCLWIVYLISALDVIPPPGFTVMDDILVFISGLYPTLIIIFVAMQKSPVEHYSTYSTPMQFARGASTRTAHG